MRPQVTCECSSTQAWDGQLDLSSLHDTLADASIQIPCIGLAAGIGGVDDRCEAGPLFLRDKLGPHLHWHEIISAKEKLQKNSLEQISLLNRQLSNAAFAMARAHPFFLSIGGDHSCAIGTWSGVAAALRSEGDLGLLWIDAHMDSHTPETTETGNIHGMPLAALLGYGDPRLTHIADPLAKLKPENVALIGIRSFESAEARLLQTLNVRIYFMEEIQKRGFETVLKEAHAYVSRSSAQYGVSFDLDSIDPYYISAVGTPVPGGLDPQQVLSAFTLFAQLPPAAFELVEYNPALDAGLNTLKFIQTMIPILKACSHNSRGNCDTCIAAKVR